MSEMSRAIRHMIEDHSSNRTLTGLPDATLEQFTSIVGAFYFDLRAEWNKRAPTTDDREAVVTQEKP